MNKNMIWAYFIQLSSHMYDDEYAEQRGWYLPQRYTENNETDVETWDTMMKFLAERNYNTVVIDLGDGVKYDSHPEICAPDAWSKEFLKQKLDEMRALGLEPVPMLNFSAARDTWLKEYRRKISTPEYYQVASDLIAEVCELFGNPKLFHLGMDAEDSSEKKFHDLTIIRGDKLWWHDVKFLAAEVEKHGARPWMYAEYYWEHPESFAENMPKNVLLTNLYLYCMRTYPSHRDKYRAIGAFEALDKLGFDQVFVGTTWVINWTVHHHRQVICHSQKVCSPEHILGYGTIPKMHTTEENKLSLMHDAHRFYVVRQELLPETF